MAGLVLCTWHWVSFFLLCGKRVCIMVILVMNFSQKKKQKNKKNTNVMGLLRMCVYANIYIFFLGSTRVLSSLNLGFF